MAAAYQKEGFLAERSKQVAIEVLAALENLQRDGCAFEQQEL